MSNLSKTLISILLSISGGALLWVSFPDINFAYAAWVAFILLFWALEMGSVFSAGVNGLLFGTVSSIGIFYWIFPMIRLNTGSVFQGIVCLAAISLYVGLYSAVWAMAVRSVRDSLPGFAWGIFAGVSWAVLEYVRSHLLSGFPLGLVGYSQWQSRSIIQIAEITGVYGVSFIVVAFNAFLFLFSEARKWSYVNVALSILFVAGASGISLLRHVPRPEGSVKFSIIQGNVDQYKKWDPIFRQEILNTYETLVSSAVAQKPDIIVWPETAVPGYLPDQSDLALWIKKLVRKTKVYHIIGAPHFEGGEVYYNGTAVFSPTGEIIAWHNKLHLVAFGEYVPFRKLLAPMFGVLNTLGDFSIGKEAVVTTVSGVKIGANICSENFYGNIIRSFTLNGANILVNQTNDAWFLKSSAAMQHFVMNVFRAIETRRPVVVCANTGVSGFIKPTGDIIAMTSIFEQAVMTESVSPMKKNTLYVKFGDLFIGLCIFIMFVMLIFTLKRV